MLGRKCSKCILFKVIWTLLHLYVYFPVDSGLELIHNPAVCRQEYLHHPVNYGQVQVFLSADSGMVY